MRWVGRRSLGFAGGVSGVVSTVNPGVQGAVTSRSPASRQGSRGVPQGPACAMARQPHTAARVPLGPGQLLCALRLACLSCRARSGWACLPGGRMMVRGSGTPWLILAVGAGSVRVAGGGGVTTLVGTTTHRVAAHRGEDLSSRLAAVGPGGEQPERAPFAWGPQPARDATGGSRCPCAARSRDARRAAPSRGAGVRIVVEGLVPRFHPGTWVVMVKR